MAKVIDTARVLVVDDYVTMRRIITSILQQFGISHVDHAGDGREALGRLARGAYDVVLCDWCMEPMSGEAFLVEARRTYPTLPIVVVSAHASSRIMDQANALGASAFLPKPFSPRDLRRVLVSSAGFDAGGPISAAPSPDTAGVAPGVAPVPRGA